MGSCDVGRTDYTRITKDSKEGDLSNVITILDETRNDKESKRLSRINLIKHRMLEIIMEEAYKPIKRKGYVDELKERFLTERNQNYFEEVLGKLSDNNVIFTLGERIHLKDDKYRKITPKLKDQLYQMIGLYNG